MKILSWSKWFLFNGLFLVAQLISAQGFGGHPPELDWKQIDTDYMRVIFPDGLQDNAQRMVNMANYLNQNSYQSVGDRKGKINIVLQNQTTIPNGYVGLAPFRSEFFTTAPQSPNILGATNWMDGLTIHEYRHVQQMLNTRRGLTKFFSFLSGQTGWAILSNLSVPNWYFEGDAVVTETALSEGGRGRQPQFSIEQRALFLNDKSYNYQKARNGSFKDIVPSHYPLGYVMGTYGRNNFGNDVWSNVLADGASYKSIFYPFSKSLEKHTGLSTEEMYKASYEEMSQKTKKEISGLTISSFQPINTTKKSAITNYGYPQFVEDGVVTIRDSYKKTSEIILISPDGEEKKIVAPGISLDGYFSIRNNLVVWTELRFDERWGNRNYSDIVLYDINTEEKRYLTSKSKLFSPDLSFDGEKIVAVDVQPDLKSRMVVLNAKDGGLIRTIENADNNFHSYPKWADDDDALVVVEQLSSGKFTIVKYDLLTEGKLTLVPPTSNVISNAWYSKGVVYFSASFSGIDNIYAVKEQKVYQLTSVELGAFEPSVSPDGTTLAFSQYDIKGYNISSLDLDKAMWKEINVIEPIESGLYRTTANEEEGGSIISSIPGTEHPVTKYKHFNKLLNPHSWSLTFSEPEYGLSVESENIMSTFTTSLSYVYNTNEKSNTYLGKFSYGALFPIMNLSIRKTKGTEAQFFNSLRPGLDTLSWGETFVTTGINIPLNFSKGNYFRSIDLTSDFSHRQVSYEQNETNLADFSFNSIAVGIVASNIRRSASQNINPRFGQSIELQLNKGLKNEAEQFVFNSQWFFPALAANHSLNADLAFQKKKTTATSPYYFNDTFVYARGYNIPLYDDLFKFGINYQLPLIYPDFGFGGIAYLHRIRLNAFYDYSVANQTTNVVSKVNYRSYGAELLFDSQLLNLVPLTFGVRQSFLVDPNPISARTDRLEFYVDMSF